MAMNWRELGKPGDPFPAWVRELKGKSGVYAIRVRGWFSTTVVYVGESHSGGLYKTLTRHFQGWHRAKKFWFAVYAPAQTDPGHTYNRGDCEVAIRCSARDRALSLQADWISRLKPRDNHAGAEEIPF